MSTHQANTNDLAILSYIDARIDMDPDAADRLSIYYPIVLEAVASMSSESFSDDDVRSWLGDRYGFDLPLHVTHALLMRCRKRGYITGRRGDYSRTNKRITRAELPTPNRQFERGYRVMLSHLASYLSEEAGSAVTESAAEARLIAFLEQSFGESVLDGSPASPSDTGSVDVSLGRYVEHAARKGNGGYDVIRRLARGMVVRQAVLFPGLDENLPSLEGLVVYLDSTVICKLLGFDTREEQAYAQEAIVAIRRAGVIVRMFDATLGEIRGILNGVMGNWGKPAGGFGPRAYSFQMPKNGYSLSDVNILMADLETQVCERTAVRVITIPERDRRYVCDEDSLVERLRDRAGREDAAYSSRVRHDVNCVAGVVTLRGAARSEKSLANTKALFVSDSRRTIRNVTRWWHEDEGRDDIPPMFGLTELANYAWLTSPWEGDESDSLIDSSLLLACSTSLLPSDGTWNRLTERLRKHVAEDTLSRETVAAVILNTDLSGILSGLEYEGWDAETICDEAVRRAVDDLSEPVRREAEERLEAQRAESAVALDEVREAANLETRRRDEEHAAEIARLRSEIEHRDRQAEEANAVEAARRERLTSGVALALVWVLCIMLTAVLTLVMMQNATAIEDRISSFLGDGSFSNSAIVDIAIRILGLFPMLGASAKRTRSALLRLMRPAANRIVDALWNGGE